MPRASAATSRDERADSRLRLVEQLEESPPLDDPAAEDWA
jgi:hypothetical protein